MPTKTVCPRCERTGFVRVEHVIKGGHSQRHYYCGACDYSWAVAEGDIVEKRKDGSDETRFA